MSEPDYTPWMESDIEIELFDSIATAINSDYPACKVTNTYTRTAPGFPCVMLYEADNFSGGMDGSNHEIASNVMYEAQVFSAKEGDSKSEAVEIMQLVNRLMTMAGFRRTSQTPAENLEDATVFRLVARYVASVQNNTIYRR